MINGKKYSHKHYGREFVLPGTHTTVRLALVLGCGLAEEAATEMRLMVVKRTGRSKRPVACGKQEAQETLKTGQM